MNYGLYNGQQGLTLKSCRNQHCSKLNTYDYLCNTSPDKQNVNFVEVQFKNTRKGYFINSKNFKLSKGDLVVVESTPGHDIGIVTLTGSLVLLQMKRRRCQSNQLKKINRKANKSDIYKFKEYKQKENSTMIQTRKIVNHFGLQMKISDVEYQGDGSKAIFYYIAEDRIDFRQLIKKLATTFHVKIEMKQIGTRQEAGQIGSIGSCGREICCAGWIANFTSVSSNTMHIQDMSTNIQKMAGKCTKLMCCLNFETNTYKEAQQKFPPRETPLETISNKYFCVKIDILKNQMYYSTNPNDHTLQLVSISSERAFEIIFMNKNKQKPINLNLEHSESIASDQDILKENINRFDKIKSKKQRNENNKIFN